MARVCGFDRGVASPESVSSVSKAVAREADDLEVEDVGGGSVGEREEEEVMDEEWGDEAEAEAEAEAELELGLALGSVKKGKASASSPHRASCCRILTAKDFPSRASQRSPCSFVSASSGTNLGGGAGVVGTKRAAESVSPDVGVSPHPPSQALVGWPPIRASRMNNLSNHSKGTTSDVEATTVKKTNRNNGNNSTSQVVNGCKDQENKGKVLQGTFFVKVKMDGDPIGRKVDLHVHNSYETLAAALELMFNKPTMTLTLANTVHGSRFSKLLDGSSEFALTYEDKDGDWMLVGDVPWQMFLETVKRLRIMKTSDAHGLSKSGQFGKRPDCFCSTMLVDQ
ncbi:auxin-responsive protein IAA10-like isoform X2 [Zingiber officinale]|uniref:auxin-responsive protein IAA10-like isoform X2 n=1 Tax=Zingiber officinale TaxID=94328 RepID=UPI001C4B7BF7|nr:auxin-responsive protein IAA10-like isoform X2 [Zingiber officinale]XP_042454057.1 auxin-responsive protein IAA10-like isoform X2 [Zingiber officinale]